VSLVVQFTQYPAECTAFEILAHAEQGERISRAKFDPEQDAIDRKKTDLSREASSRDCLYEPDDIEAA
jgi:hypothetical protein